MYLNAYILLKKSFAPLTLISLYFKLSIPVKSRKMIWSSSIFQRVFSEPITLDPVKDRYFWEVKLFLFKNHIFGPKMLNNLNYGVLIMSSSIVMWDLIKIDSKLQKLQPFSSIYPNEKLVKFQKLWLLQNAFSYPIASIDIPQCVATRKVKWCMLFHHFDQQSSLKSFINKG